MQAMRGLQNLDSLAQDLGLTHFPNQLLCA